MTQTPIQSRTTPGPPPLMPGARVLTVSFAGDVNYEASTSRCTFTVGNTPGSVHGETKQKTALSSMQLHTDVRSTSRGLRGEVEFEIERGGAPSSSDRDSEFRSRAITALGIAPDGHSAWIAGIGRDGRAFVIYAEVNSPPERDDKDKGKSSTPRKPDVAQIWIAGALQNGDGIATNGRVQIALPRPGERFDD